MEKQSTENSQTENDQAWDPRIRNLMALASTKNRTYSGEAIKTCSELHYERVFLRMINGKKICWNFAAMLWTINWMFYRKMYGAAFLYLFLGLPIAFSILTVGYLLFPEMREIYLVMGVMSHFLFMGVFGNYIYYRHLQKKIKRGYHHVETLKNVDRISLIFAIFAPCLNFLTGAIISILDRRKVQKYNSGKI